MSTYEPIMTALLALLQAKCGGTFQTYKRRFVMWEQLAQQVPAIAQPALFLFDGVGLGGGRIKYAQKQRGLPPRRTLLRTIVLYAQIPGGGTPGGPDATTPGGTVLGPLAESVEAALATVDDPVQGTLTLGGLVSHCWIEGDGHWVVGDIDPNGQGMVTIPVNIMVP